MTEELDYSVNFAALKKKLEIVGQSLAALSPLELRALTENPNLLRQVFAVSRKTRVKRLDRKMRTHVDKLESAAPVFAPVVEVTREQRAEARRIQMEIWKKQGIADEMVALARIRGERRDPFAAQDPEPASDKGE